MKPIKKEELFEHLSGFLKDKGVELKEGSYVQTLQKSCSFLTDAINLGQKGFGRAREGMDKAVDQMRQVIHEKTAPQTAASATPPPAAEKAEPKARRTAKQPAPVKRKTARKAR